MLEVVDALKLFGGFVYLLLGGELLVRGALGFSRESQIPPVIVGMTVVAMGTSAPELMVSVFSTLSGHAEIAIGNVIGSNIANVLLVLGVPVLIYPICCAQEELPRQSSLMIAVSVMFIVLCAFAPITFWEGVLLVSILATFLYVSTRGAALIAMDSPEEELELKPGMPSQTATIISFIILGAIALPLGADLVVEGGVGLASSWGVSEAVIGLSLIALGTSLPELSTTIFAALHKSADVAIGNVIGSNLFNILAIVGITALLTDIPVSSSFLAFDIWFMLASSVLLWVLVLARATIGRAWGMAFLAGYLLYMTIIY